MYCVCASCSVYKLYMYKHLYVHILRYRERWREMFLWWAGFKVRFSIQCRHLRICMGLHAQFHYWFRAPGYIADFKAVSFPVSKGWDQHPVSRQFQTPFRAHFLYTLYIYSCFCLCICVYVHISLLFLLFVVAPGFQWAVLQGLGKAAWQQGAPRRHPQRDDTRGDKASTESHSNSSIHFRYT